MLKKVISTIVLYFQKEVVGYINESNTLKFVMYIESNKNNLGEVQF
ncbi:hypothetical protein [Caloranaerobacter sp. DY30410]